MRSLPLRMCAASVAILVVAACSGTSEVPHEARFGPNPTLPAPSGGLFPTVNVADAVGWRDGRTPVAAHGLAVAAFASGLDHPRWLYLLPNGDFWSLKPMPRPSQRASPVGYAPFSRVFS